MRYTKKASLEGSAAFSDGMATGQLKEQERYQKGYSADDPEQLEESKLNDQATSEVNKDLNSLLEDTQNSLEETNPFVDAEPPKAVETGEYQKNQQELDPSDTVESGKAAVDSLESIIEDLEEVQAENQPNARSTQPVLDVYLDDDSKELLDQDIDAAIAKDPEQMESLESIKLCGERSVSTILSILKHKRDQLGQ